MLPDPQIIFLSGLEMHGTGWRRSQQQAALNSIHISEHKLRTEITNFNLIAVSLRIRKQVGVIA